MELFASMSKPGWLFIQIQTSEGGYGQANVEKWSYFCGNAQTRREIYVNSKLRLQRSLIFIREETSRAQQKYEEQSNHLNES